MADAALPKLRTTIFFFFFLFIYFYLISKSRRPWVSQVSHFFQSSRNLEVVLIPTTRVTQRYTGEPRTKFCERSLSCGKTTIQRLMYRHNGGEIGYRICQNSLSSCWSWSVTLQWYLYIYLSTATGLTEGCTAQILKSRWRIFQQGSRHLGGLRLLIRHPWNKRKSGWNLSSLQRLKFPSEIIRPGLKWNSLSRVNLKGLVYIWHYTFFVG